MKTTFPPGHSNTNSILNGGGPKYGTLIPNRVFVGGISNTTTEADLHKLFSEYGNVRATKIISDRGGASKGYGFVTFETEEEAKKLQDEVSGQIGSQTQLTGTPISWSACAPLSSAAHNFMPPQSAPSGIHRNAIALKKYLSFPCPAVTSRH